MDNHFHLLVRVPHRSEGFDVPLEVVVAHLDRALGEESAKLMHRNLARMFCQLRLAMHLGFAA